MIRVIAATTLCGLLGSAVAADRPPPVVPAPSCQAPAAAGDSRDITCAIAASGRPQRFRFTVSFLGGHDDTRASIQPALDGVPIDCAPGSKTSLFGEDGEVSLHCDFSVQDNAGKTHVVAMAVLWSHAQYKDFALVAQ